MTARETEFTRRLRADAIRHLAVCETVTRLLPESIRYTTLERRVLLRKTIREYDALLSRER